MINAIEAAGAKAVRAEYAGNLSRDAANEAAQQLVNTARENGSHTLYSEFIKGTTPINGHFAWVPTYENDVMKKWLFTNIRGN